MQNASGKAMDVAGDNAIALFVHFDFLFFPMRVHSGQGPVHWEGHEWQGIGDVLRQDASSKWSTLSSQTSERGTISASLPMIKEMDEILSKEYHRDREMQWVVCAMDADFEVARRVCINRGRIVSYTSKDDTVTFTAECELFDSLQEKDARHKGRVSAVRRRFKSNLAQAVVTSGLGWAISLLGVIEGAMGFFVDVLEVVVPGRNWRTAKQRWSARRRMYWFKTEPRIPGLRMRRNGYKARGDTLDEAKVQLYELVARGVWKIPPGFVSMIIYWNGRPLEYLNLDTIRQTDDPRRYEETRSARRWPP